MHDHTRIVYATSLFHPLNPGDRVARATQSAAATRLLRHLVEREGPALAYSKSHSRAAVAAAATPIPEVVVGIDIEWIAPERPIEAMARSLLGEALSDIGVQNFYRLWTFREAYFKTFRRTPDPATAFEFIAYEASPAIHRLKDGTSVLEHRVAADAFQLCLVWSGTASTPLYLGEVSQC